MRGSTATIAFALAALATASVPPAAAQESITGTARVVHSNLIAIDGVAIRLFGIDVLERDQTCDNGLVEYPCGQVAAGRLAHALVNQTVACRLRERAVDDMQPVATCHVGETDIADWLVRTGFALADRAHPEIYAEAEAEARGHGTGIWRGPFVLPWDWRAGERAPAMQGERF